MARPKKQIITTEVETPAFAITLTKRDLCITLTEKENCTISVSSSALDKIDSVYKLIEYRDLLNSVIDEYFEHTMPVTLDNDSKECANIEDDLKPCDCHG